MDIAQHWMPVPKRYVGSAFITRIEATEEKAEFRFYRKMTAFHHGIN